MRLQRERFPDARDGRLTQAFVFCQIPGAPVGRIARRRLEGRGDRAFNLRVGDLPRRPRARLIEQSSDPGRHEPRAPFADGLERHIEVRRDGRVRGAGRAAQDDPRAQGQRLRRRGSARILLERGAFRRTQNESRNRAAESHVVSSSLYTTYDCDRHIV